MKILGVSAGFHDAALTVLHNHKILFSGHAERYSKNCTYGHFGNKDVPWEKIGW